MRLLIVITAVLGIFFMGNSSIDAAEQDASVKGIAYRGSQEGRETIAFSLNGPHIPKVFMLRGDNPRLVLDFLQAGYLGKNDIDVADSALVEAIRVGVHTTPQLKTRVVIDLAGTEAVDWDQNFVVHQNTLLIHLARGGSSNTNAVTEKLTLAPSRNKIKTEAPVRPSKPKPPVSPSATASSSATDAEAAPEQALAPQLLEVTFDNVYAKSGEMVLFKLNDFHPPVVAAIEKGVPKVVCDFPGASMAPTVPDTIDAGGRFIARIRTAEHTDNQKVRVVLDLVTGRDYELQQVFFKEDNLFVLIINTLGPEEAVLESSTE